MKRYNNRIVTASKDDESLGTTYYKVPVDLLKDYYRTDDNVVMRYLVLTYGFNAFDLDKMYGSYFDEENDVLYICQTDGSDIRVGSQLKVDPEQALEDFSIEDLSMYVKDGTDETVRRYLTYYELLPQDLDDLVWEMLNEDEGSVVDIFNSLLEIDWL